MGVKYLSASAYKDDVLNLPVASVADAVEFYKSVLGFEVSGESDEPVKTVKLKRDDVEIGLAENGGDPSQEGAFFLVDDVEAALKDLQSNGLKISRDGLRVDKHGDKSFKVFFVVAPDGLCYCVGEEVDG